MPNDLTALAPTLYSAAREVAAEPFGIIDAINSDFNDQGVAIGDTVDVPVAPPRAAKDFTPGNITTTGDDATGTDIEVAITKSRKVDWNLTGEQIRSLENGGINQNWVSQLIAQGMRTLRNEAEADCAIACKLGASRAVGVGGTTPFASNLGALTAAKKVLKDNGAPMADAQFIFDTNAELNLSNLGIIQEADKAGSDEERRTGTFKPQFGFRMATSAGIDLHTAGTGAGYLVNDAALALGDTGIALDTGTGTVLSGDVVTFAGDANQYVAGTGIAAPGNLILNEPGLRTAVADDAAMTIVDGYTANIAMERSAVVGVMRPPLIPANPTIQQMLISDQFGMTYLMLDIAQYGQRTWELHLAWGFKAVNGQFICLVLG